MEDVHAKASSGSSRLIDAEVDSSECWGGSRSNVFGELLFTAVSRIHENQVRGRGAPGFPPLRDEVFSSVLPAASENVSQVLGTGRPMRISEVLNGRWSPRSTKASFRI